jgi:tight adherence protein B
MEPITLVIAGVAAIAILLIAIGASSRGSGGAINARLERYAAGVDDSARTGTQQNISDLIAGSDAINNFNKAMEQRSYGANIARDIARADLHLKVSEYMAIKAGAVVAVPLIFLLLSFVVAPLGNPIALVIGVLIGWILPGKWLARRRGSRFNAFNKQLPDTIMLIANALRAGSSFLQAIELVVREARPPISIEFGRVIREVNLGLPFETALENMVRRVKSDDLELMATAISIQHTVGGNLAEILDSIAFTIRERIRIKGEIRTLTAQQRLSGYVVGFLPMALGGFLFVAAPGFMAPMFANPPAVLGLPAGVIVLAFGGFMMFLGFMMIRKIVDIEV